MKEELINLKTAKLAKEKKFDIYCKVGFIEQLEDKTSLHIKPGVEVDYLWEPSFEEPEDYWQAVLDMEQPEIKYYPRPTQSLLQKWLREKHGVQIDVKSVLSKNGWKYKVRIRTEHIGLKKGKQIFKYEFPDNPYFDTYEEALEKGLFEALKSI